MLQRSRPPRSAPTSTVCSARVPVDHGRRMAGVGFNGGLQAVKAGIHTQAPSTFLWSIACISLLVVVSCAERPLGRGHYRWEGIHGFAIWPEDQPEDGLTACEQRINQEPWRTDPGATAHKFVRSVLNWQRPPDTSNHDVPKDAPRTVFSMADGSMPARALGVVIHLRQLRGCWFVAAVWPREGEIAGTYRWVERDQRYALRASWRGHEPINLEVGWGKAIRREKLRPGDSLTVPIPDSDSSGHVLWFYDSPSENTFGQPLSPPPRIP